MHLTNSTGLPHALVAAASTGTRQPWEANRISVTELIGPPQIRMLSRQHWDELTEDVADRIWAVLGTSLHALLDTHSHANTLTEERLAIEVAGWTVSGQPDLYEVDGTLSDWKFTSAWSLVYGIKREWHAQLNCYAALLRAHGFPVTRVQNIVILRDWSKHKAAQEADYPKQQVVTVAAPLWTEEQCTAYIAERVQLHQAAAAGDVPPCTAEERWEKATTFAVYKNDNKRAARVLDSQDEADAWVRAQAADIKARWRIEVRPGESTRCSAYCRCAPHCQQWQALRAQQEQAV